DVEPHTGEDVGERPHGRGLAGAAFLREDRDRGRHAATISRRRGPRRSPFGRLDDARAEALGRRPPAVLAEAQVVQAEAPDVDLVAVLELAHVHPRAVHEDAVQAPVVEYPRAAVLAVDQGGAPRPRRT